MSSTEHIWMGSSGCLLPLLIIFNLFFGKLIFDSTGLWLGVEAVLILIFMLKIRLIASRIRQQFEPQGRGLDSASQSHRSEGSVSGRPQSQSHKPMGKVIDVQGQEVKDEKELR